jgi:hypothetical protein
VRLSVLVFEAAGEGAKATYSGGALKITHPVWRRGDSHAGPSSSIDEIYVWNSTHSRFESSRRAEVKRE